MLINYFPKAAGYAIVSIVLIFAMPFDVAASESNLYILGDYISRPDPAWRTVRVQKNGWSRRTGDVFPTDDAIRNLHRDLSPALRGNISIFYGNLATGWSYGFNEHRPYFSASVPKAMLALDVYMRAGRGEFSLDDTLVFRREHVFAPVTTVLSPGQVGQSFSIRDLLIWNTSYSDCSATRVLALSLGVDSLRQLIVGLGDSCSTIGDVIVNSSITAFNSALHMQAIHNFIESHNRYAGYLRRDLLNNRNPFISSSSGYVVASKTGWTRGRAWHDMAIIYADSPFVLVILTDRQGWSEQDYLDFALITRVFEEFNRRWF